MNESQRYIISSNNSLNQVFFKMYKALFREILFISSKQIYGSYRVKTEITDFVYLKFMEIYAFFMDHGQYVRTENARAIGF